MNELDGAGADAGVEEGPVGRPLAAAHATNVPAASWNCKKVVRPRLTSRSPGFSIMRNTKEYRVKYAVIGDQQAREEFAYFRLISWVFLTSFDIR